MKNTATLGQITKILSLLEGVPSEMVQAAIENGTLAEAVQGKTRKERLKNNWRIVCLTMRPEDIVVTKPHAPCTYYSAVGKGGKYQVRVWKGKRGYFGGQGHVDDAGLSQEGGQLLFETYEDIPQTSAQHPTYESEMQNIDRTFPGYEWQKDTLDTGKGLLDVFTLRCMRNGF